MKFKETLEIANKHKIDTLKLLIADNVHCNLDSVRGNEEAFEEACEIVKKLYLKTNGLFVGQIVAAIETIMFKEKIPLEDIEDDYIIEKAYEFGE